MWEACGGKKMPVAIHTSDPEAFFLPIDRFNERFEELNAHPDWSFHGRDFPAFTALIEARQTSFKVIPGTSRPTPPCSAARRPGFWPFAAWSTLPTAM